MKKFLILFLTLIIGLSASDVDATKRIYDHLWVQGNGTFELNLSVIGDISADNLAITNWNLAYAGYLVDHAKVQYINVSQNVDLDDMEADIAENQASIEELTVGGLLADSIDATHLDWGTGQHQISADDIPDGDTKAIITLVQEGQFDSAFAKTRYVTDQEINQIENIGAVNISYSEWYRLSLLDQEVGTTKEVTHAGLEISSTDPVITITDTEPSATHEIKATTGGLEFKVDPLATSAWSSMTFEVDGADRLIFFGGNVIIPEGTNFLFKDSDDYIINEEGSVLINDDLSVTGEVSASNLSGTNTGDQNDYTALDNLPTLGTASAQNVGYFATALGADDNYVTDAEKTVIENTSNTNTGDQTDITGISSTKSEFNTSLSDGTFLFVGDVADVNAEVNVQSDWNQSDTGADDYIENKPTTISVAQADAITSNTGKITESTTVNDTSEIDLTLSTYEITADIVSGSIDESKLDTSVNLSLDLADSAIQNETDPKMQSLTSSEVDQLENIGTETISSTQWGYLSDLDQGVEIDADVDFADIDVERLELDLTDGSQSEFIYLFNYANPITFSGAGSTSGMYLVVQVNPSDTRTGDHDGVFGYNILGGSDFGDVDNNLGISGLNFNNLAMADMWGGQGNGGSEHISLTGVSVVGAMGTLATLTSKDIIGAFIAPTGGTLEVKGEITGARINGASSANHVPTASGDVYGDSIVLSLGNCDLSGAGSTIGKNKQLSLDGAGDGTGIWFKARRKNDSDITGWTQYSTTEIYQYTTNFEIPDRVFVFQEDLPLTFVAWDSDIATTSASMSEGTYSYDNSTEILYVWATGEGDPDVEGYDIDARARFDGKRLWLEDDMFHIDAGLNVIERATGNKNTFFSSTSADSYINNLGGDFGIGTNSPTEKIDADGDAIRIRDSQTPTSQTMACDKGTIAWDEDYIYVCTATDYWERTAISNW